MKAHSTTSISRGYALRRQQRGQTLVMALIILGVLLILGVVFIAVIGRNIRNTGRHHQRTLAYDLAEAGVRHAHAQMLNSVDGADWRPTPTPLFASTDPDYEYLRLPNPADPNDHGGPDRQGPYTRLIFDKGRALIRVRYAPSDPTVFSTAPVGDMLQPGAARNYTIIESVGKASSLNLNDPTQTSLQSGAAREVAESKKVIAFVSIGMIEHARYITNKYNVSAPAEIGFPDLVGITYGDNGNPAQPVRVPVMLGDVRAMQNPYSTGAPAPSAPVPYGGSLFSNANLVIHGEVIANVNPMLGDGIYTSETIRGADDAARLTLSWARPAGTTWNTGTTILQNNIANSLNSNSANFYTDFGIVKDGIVAGDRNGHPRGIGVKSPPSILRADPDTGLNRYVQITQFSGRIYNDRNSGIFGHGQGVYVNNSADIQIPVDAQGREDVGSAESLAYDWLNPNNGQANSGWQGAFYVPRGAYLRLYNDGFIILRDGRAPQNQRTWRMPDGSPGKRPGAAMTSTNPADILDSPYCRFKLVRDNASGVTYIFNSYSVMPNGTTVDLNQINSTNIGNWAAAGHPFNGVLYFAGNVRVRGQIPTDMQMTVVSNATIYIEGSITKGVVNNGTRTNMPIGRRIDTPSKSMIALMAKDYVTLNTTQFFGSPPEQTLEEVSDNPGPVERNPVRVRTGNSLSLMTEFLLDPTTGIAGNPSSWEPFLTEYTPAGSVGGYQPATMILTHTMDDGPAPATFLNIDVNYRVGAQFATSGEWQYLFDLNNNNAATPYYPIGYTTPSYSVANRAPLYGLGGQSWQRYSKFESMGFQLVSNDFTFDPLLLTLNGANTSPTGLYHLLIEGGNAISLGIKETIGGTPTNDYVVARAAIVPHDIRIEAAIFAEEGSFFVIPGHWFNPDPNDRRDTYLNLGTTQQERDAARLETFGSSPDTPFFGEPLDVRIQIFGSVTENMPPPMSHQAEWLKKWGWTPRFHGATGQFIPQQHVPAGYNVAAGDPYVPNITITFDPVLATDRNVGFVGAAGPNVDFNTLIRSIGMDVDGNGSNDVFYALPALPRLPVSPTLAYFGEVNP